MMLAIVAVIILFLGAGVSAMLAGRTALAVSLSAVLASGGLCGVSALGALTRATAGAARSFAWAMPLGHVELALDGLSAWFLLAIGVLSIAVAVYSWGYFETSPGSRRGSAAGALICLLVSGMILTVCATDVVLFLAGWELMSLSAFLLVGFDHHDPAARRGAWTYLVATHLGTAIGVVPVLAYLAGRSGSTSFAGFSGVAGSLGPWTGVALFALGTIGFGTKAGLAPLHVWLPEAHPVAPSPVSALMSGVVIKTGVYGLLRLLSWLGPLPRGCAFAIMMLGVATGLTGILYAIASRRYKRMLAYSSVENIGIIMLGVGTGMLGHTLHQPALVVLGYGGALLHVLNHSLFKGLLFLSAGAVLRGTGMADGDRLGGVGRRDPSNAALFLTGAVAIAALPPLNGFVSEFLIYSGLLSSASQGSLRVAALAALSVAGLALIGGLALCGFARLFGVIFLGEAREPRVHVHPASRSMIAGMAILALCCLLAGVGAPVIGGLLDLPIRSLHADAPLADQVLRPTLTTLSSVSAAFLLLAAVFAGLLVLRRRLAPAALHVPSQATWGCGYAYPTARMQYSGSSFAWKLVGSFRHIIRPHRTLDRPSTCFPRKGHLATRTSDLAMRGGYRPLFLSLARGCERLWPLQHGRIQLYLVYIVAALLIVFAVEVWVAPTPARSSSTPTSGMTARTDGPSAAGIREGGEQAP